MVDDPHLPPRLRQARRSHSHCVEERSRLVLERVHLVDACRVHARRSEVECRNTVPLRAEHGDHLVPAPCSMAKAMDRDEMLATATAAAFHFLKKIRELPQPGAHDGVVGPGNLFDFHARAQRNHVTVHLLQVILHGHQAHPLYRTVVGTVITSGMMPMCLPTHGTAAATNTATAIFSGNLSMARAMLRPPKLCPTRISLSPAGASATASRSGCEYSSKECTSSIRAGWTPDAARSSAVTRCHSERSMNVAEFPGLGVHDGVVSSGNLLDVRARAHRHHPPLHLLGAGAVSLGDHVHLLHRSIVAIVPDPEMCGSSIFLMER
uniref:Uncharacterized protein n=1 Tax=Oryza nivara TaxID=4536 RepID=A0A0E0FYF4_ORYNI